MMRRATIEMYCRGMKTLGDNLLTRIGARSFRRALILVAFYCVAIDTASATSIVNGDFATGDLSGWTVSAVNDSNNPIDPSPFINVTTLGSNNVAQFETGEFDDGVFIATLEESDLSTPLQIRFGFSNMILSIL